MTSGNLLAKSHLIMVFCIRKFEQNEAYECCLRAVQISPV